MNSFLVLLLSYFVSMMLWLWNVPPAFFAPLVPEIFICGLLVLVIPTPMGTALKTTQLPSMIKWSVAIFTILFCESFLRGIQEWVTISAEHPLCLGMPGIFQKIECIFGAATDQNYALRQLLSLITGTFIFVALLAASNESRFRILRGVQLAGVSFALASYMAHFGYIKVPDGWFDPAFADRFCYFVGNPSWIAPILAPSLLASAVFIIVGGRFSPLNLLLIIPMVDIILRSQQRGGLIVVLFFLCWLVMFYGRNCLEATFNRLRERKKSLVLAAATAAIVIYFAMPFIWRVVTDALHMLGFGERLAATGFVSSERLIIWRAAWNELQGKVLTGHGYGTWYRSGAVHVPRYGLSDYFDTAHNFFVQYLFEHGAVAFALWIAALSAALIGLWRNAHGVKRWIIVSVFLIFAPIMFFQEIDFLRSGFYLSMASIGAAAGICSSPNGHSPRVSVGRRWIFLRALIGIGAVIFACVFFFGFSTAGYQYEANVVHKYGPQVRWFRQSGQINFISNKAKRREQYAIYQIQKANADKLELIAPHSVNLSDSVLIASAPQQQHFIPVRARSVLEKADFYILNNANKLDGRQLGMMLGWPPSISTLPVLKVTNAISTDLSPWSESLGKGFLCESSCEFQFLTCPSSKIRKIIMTTSQDFAANEMMISIHSDSVAQIEHVRLSPQKTIETWANTGLKIHIKSDNQALGLRPKLFVFGEPCR